MIDRDERGLTPIQAVLSDGTVVTVRPLGGEDLRELRRLHRQTTMEDRYFRFFGFPSDAALDEVMRRLVDEPAGSLALGLFRRGRLVAVGQLDRVAADTAEIAFLVEHDLKGHGAATLLLEHLVAAARRWDIHTLVAELLAQNSEMLRVLADSGLRYRTQRQRDVVHVVISLAVAESYYVRTSGREAVADRESLRSVFAPRSLVIVGASSRRAAVGNAVLDNVLGGRYSGRVDVVNRRGGLVGGLHAYCSVDELPEPPDLAVLCVPTSTLVEAAEQCGRRGVRALVVITAGVSHDTSVSEGLIAAVRRWGMRLVGPNCIGLVNADPEVCLDATFSAAGAPRGEIGVATQSGGVAIALLEGLRGLGLGVSTLLSAGDKRDVSGNDMLLWWQRDEHTRIAVLYLESFGNPRKFSWLARRANQTMPIIMMRAGATPIAREATFTHTAARTAPATAWEALLHQTGIIGVNGVEELLGVTACLEGNTHPVPGGTAVISNAGGLGILTVDACARAGAEIALISADTRTKLSNLLPKLAAIGTLIDTTPDVADEVFRQSTEILLEDPEVSSVVAVTVKTRLADPGAAIAHEPPGRNKLLLRVQAGQQEAVRREGGGPPSMADPDLAGRCAAAVHSYAEWLQRDQRTRQLVDVDVDAARRLVATALAEGPGWLSPGHSTELAECFGLPDVSSRACSTESTAVAAVQQAQEHVVVKAHLAPPGHETSTQDILARLSTVAEMREVWNQFTERFRDAFRGVVIQPHPPHGHEFAVKVVNETSFGPIVSCGITGQESKLMDDRSHRLVPLSDQDVGDMLNDLRAAPHVFGSNATEPVDPDRLVDVVLRTARMAETVPEIADVELDPVIVTSNEVAIVDLRVRLTETESEDPLVRRLRV